MRLAVDRAAGADGLYRGDQEATGVDDRAAVNLRCSVLVFRGDAMLLCQRIGRGGEEWVLPGGTPRIGEAAAACALRETREETGLLVDPARIAFVLDATNPKAGQHLIEIVFLGHDIDPAEPPRATEPGLRPQFVPLAALGRTPLRPPIAGHIRGLHAVGEARTAAYLGNVWRPEGSRR
jgi:8-oxo-dGTP diphosphatase